MLKPFCPQLNRAILQLAPAFEVRDSAPETLVDVTRCFREQGKLVVWSGGSDMTIFGDPAVNHAFRAWHDYHHVKHQYAFDLAGERATCFVQIDELRTHLGRGAGFAARLIEAEVIGQAQFFEQHGFFPNDQRYFVRRYLDDRSLGT